MAGDDVPLRVTGAPVLDPNTGQLVDSRTGLPIASSQAPVASQAPPAAPTPPAGPPPSIPNTEGWTPPPAAPSPPGGAQSSDLQLGKGGVVQNPGDFTPGQLTDLLHSGKISFGNYQQAILGAAPPANNAGDQAAMASDQAAHANSGRYGTKGPPPPKQAEPATPAAPSGPTGNIVTRQAPPGAGAAGPNPYAALPLGMAGATGVRQVGLSGADKGLLSAEDAREKARQDSLNAATEQARALQNDLTNHGQAVLDESKAAKDKAEAEAEQDKATRDAIAQRYKDNQTRIESQLAQLQAQGIDPNRYYRNQSTPQRIAAGVAVALGEVGAGPLGPRGTRGTNDALKIIQQAQQDDLDSQKTDMQNRLAIMGKRMDNNREGFSQEMALNQAQAESRQSLHAVTQNYISRLASQYAQTDDQKAKIQQIQTQLANDNYTALGNHQNIEFQTRKGAEKLVATGPAQDPRVKEWNSYRHELAVAHPELSGDQLDAKTADYFHQPGVPGVGVPQIAAKGGSSARVARTLAEYSANKKALDDLRAYASKPLIVGEDKGKVDALVQRLRNAGMDVPTGFTDRLFGTTGGSVSANRALVNEQINTLQNTMAHGMAGGGEDESDELSEAP